MRDEVRIDIYKKGLSGACVSAVDFRSYSIDSDLYQAADAFSIECSDASLRVDPGMGMRLFVNGAAEMTGIIDGVEATCDKQGPKLSLSGRDLSGLLVDSCVEDYGEENNYNGKTVAQVARLLLAKVPFIRAKDIVYERGADRFNEPFAFGCIKPGETVFAVLSRYAAARGLVFWCAPDGRLIFGRPKTTGDVRYHLLRKKPSGPANNIIDGGLRRDLSRAFTKVTVISQNGDAEAGEAGDEATAYMPAGVFPPGFYKPGVRQINGDSVSPSRAAALMISQMRARALAFTYTTSFHSYNGRNWTAGELCRIDDDVVSVAGDYLIYGRTFTMDKRAGPRTELRLGLPGLVAGE